MIDDIKKCPCYRQGQGEGGQSREVLQKASHADAPFGKGAAGGGGTLPPAR